MGLGLKTDYKDDILDTTTNTTRKYKTSYDNYGLLSLEDKTEYNQVGDSFGAKELNETNAKINDFYEKVVEDCVGYYGGSEGWYKVYSTTLEGFRNNGGRLSIIYGDNNNNKYGVINFRIRCNGTTSLVVDYLTWETRTGFDVGDVIIVTENNIWSLYVYNYTTKYGRIKIRVLDSLGTSDSSYGYWVMKLKNNGIVEATAPTPTVVATDGATVNYANSAGSAATATKATKDSANQQINTTYIKGLSISGSTITYTKGDGTTGTVSLSSELAKYIPFSDTNVTLKKGGMLAPNGDIYLSDYSTWASSWLNVLQTAVNNHNNGVNISVPTYNDFGGVTGRNIYFKNILKWICSNYPGVTNRTWFFKANPDSSGWSCVFIYDTSDTVDGLPRYGSGIFIPLNEDSVLHKYGVVNGEYYFVNSTSDFLTPSSFTVSGNELILEFL